MQTGRTATAWLWVLLKAMSANTENCNSMAMGLAEGNVSKHRDLHSMAMALANSNVSKHRDLQ